MRLPTIHINGTHRNNLLEGLSKVSSTLGDALYAMRRASPNARDYYPQGQEAFAEAASGHASRIERISSVAAEIEAMIEHVLGEPVSATTEGDIIPEMEGGGSDPNGTP